MSADWCRTAAIDRAFQRYQTRRPVLPPEHSPLCQVVTSIALSFVIRLPGIISEWQGGRSAVAFKPVMGGHASNLNIRKVARQSKITPLFTGLSVFHCMSHNAAIAIIADLRRYNKLLCLGAHLQSN